MKRISIFKRLLILILVFILSINSFAAVVADNDGATFITKAEFDSLKNNFQAQIDNYNISIDSKIEGAIASYLAGIKIATEVNQPILFPNATTDGVTCFNYNGWFSARDVLGLPEVRFKFADGKLEYTYKNANVFDLNSTWSSGKRVGLENVQYYDSKDIGSWYGFVSDVHDTLSLFINALHNSGNFGNASTTNLQYGGTSTFIHTGVDAGEGSTVMQSGTIRGPYIWWNEYFDTTNWINDVGNKSRYIQKCSTAVTGAVQTHGDVTKPLLCIEKSLAFKRFSDFGNPTRWCGTSNDADAGWPGTDNRAQGWFSDKNYGNTIVWNGSSGTDATTIIHIGSTAATDDTHYHYKPLFGIMGDRVARGVKDWANVYEPSYDQIWDSKWETKYSSTNLKKFALKDKKGKWHLSLNAGFPLASVQKDKRYKMKLTADVTSQWRLWIQLGPFINESDNVSSSYTPLNLTSHTRDSSKGNAYILNKTDTIEFVAPDDGILFLKWKSNMTNFTSNDYCLMKPDQYIIMINE